LSVDVTSAPVPDSGCGDGMTITGFVNSTNKLVVAAFIVWVLASAVMMAAYLGLMEAFGVL
jgi:hypothetical protein